VAETRDQLQAYFMDGMSINFHYRSVPMRTEEEQQSNPYPEHLQIRAHGYLETKRDLKDGGYSWTVNDYGLPARILERHVSSTEHTYTVAVGISISKEAFEDSQTRDREANANLTWVTRYKVPQPWPFSTSPVPRICICPVPFVS
jgi:hypothetical protein